MENLSDVAKELNWSYFQAKKNCLKSTKENNIYVGILKNLFCIYGVYFGYPCTDAGFSQFKGDVIRIKNRLKKEKKKIIVKHQEFKENFWADYVETNPIFHPSEGDGGSYIEWQIKNLDLDPNSY